MKIKMPSESSILVNIENLSGRNFVKRADGNKISFKNFSWNCDQNSTEFNSPKIHVILYIKGFTQVLPLLGDINYGHTKAKSLILCGPNSNPNPK